MSKTNKMLPKPHSVLCFNKASENEARQLFIKVMERDGKMKTGTETNGNKYFINGIEVEPDIALDAMYTVLKKEAKRIKKLLARIEKLDATVSNLLELSELAAKGGDEWRSKLLNAIEEIQKEREK